MSYVKNYEIGNIRLEAPYSHFIYELPILSFGDVLHTVNLSLIFNSRLIGKNPFYLSNGHKLNLQKRLIITGGVPGIYENGDGSCVNLIEQSNNKYTFNDDSQRIIRGTGQAYILENPDYSTETYTTLGKIKSVADKYGETLLTYTYDESQHDKLTSITYRNNKVINLTYNNLGVISSVEYFCDGAFVCRTTLAYPGSSHTIVGHYSGVNYYTSYSGNEFTAYSANGSTYSDYCHKIICTKDTDSLEFERFIGAKTVDMTRHDFINIVNDRLSIVDITNFHGVKTRIQYKDNTPLYIYEVGDTLFRDNKYVGNVQMYGIDNAVKNHNTSNCQTANHGAGMTYTVGSNRQGWKFLNLPTGDDKHIYFVSGWIKISEAYTDDDITINIAEAINKNIEKQVTFAKPMANQWVFFTVGFNYSKSKICTFVQQTVDAIETKDFRITAEVLEAYDENSNSYFRSSSNMLFIGETTSANLSDVTFLNCSGTESDTVYYEDILRYKINQKLGIHQNEFYLNKCQKVVTLSSPNAVIVQYNGGNYLLSECFLGKQNYSSTHGKFLTRFRDDIYPSEGTFATETLNSNFLTISSQVCDSKLDIISSTSEGIKTTYTRNSNGLITSQSVGEVNGNNNITVYASYDSNNTKLLTTTDEFNNVTTYTTDPVWGVVTNATLSDGTSVTYEFDSDYRAILSKTFGKGSNTQSHNFTYLYTGNLHTIQNDSLIYTFGYDSGILSSVQKGNDYMGQSDISDDRMTVTTYYPQIIDYEYTVTQKYDKYGRTDEITGRIQNDYKINPTYSNGVYTFIDADNGSSRLAASTDLVTGEITRFAYERDRISRIGVFNSSNSRATEENLAYDAMGRVTEDKFIYDEANAKYVKSSITYARNEIDPLADNRLNSYIYYLDTQPKAITSYSYDYFKRIHTKTTQLTSDLFIKVFDYEKTRVRGVYDTFGDTILGTDSFEYDSQGRIVSHNFVSDHGSQGKIYVYDDFGQLIRENNKALDKTFIYCYDSIGNISKVESYPYTIGAVSGDSTDQAYNYDATHSDRLIDFNGKSILYNNKNCPIRYHDRILTWNRGKLTAITKGSTSQVGSLYENCSFTYDSYGRRRTKTCVYDSNPASTSDYSYRYDTTYTYDNSGRLIHETLKETMTYSGGGSTTREFVYLYDESGMIGVMYGSSMDNLQPYYYRRNPQGDVIAIYDANGNRKVEYAYDAWGNCSIVYGISHDLARRNPIRYRGYYFDRETGLYYLNARYYNPEWRRFISPDNTYYLDPETPNGLNLYCYCNNDPVNYADPSGNSVVLLIAGLISSAVLGGLISGGIAVGTAALTGGDVVAAFWGGFATGALSSLAVGVGMAIGGGFGLLACGGVGFAAGFGGNIVNQSISSYRETGSVKINFGDAVFAGVTNSLVCIMTMVGMNSAMSDSFSPALSGKTFKSRFIEFMSFDYANTMYSTYFGIMYGLFDGAVTLAKYLVELEISKYTTTSSLLANH